MSGANILFEEENEELPLSKRPRIQEIDLSDEIPLALKELRSLQKEVQVLTSERALFQDMFQKAFSDALLTMEKQKMDLLKNFEEERKKYVEIIESHKKDNDNLSCKLQLAQSSNNCSNGENSGGSKKQTSLMNQLDTENRRLNDELKVCHDNQDKMKAQIMIMKSDVAELQKNIRQQTEQVNCSSSKSKKIVEEELLSFKNELQNKVIDFRENFGRLSRRVVVLERSKDIEMNLHNYLFSQQTPLAEEENHNNLSLMYDLFEHECN